MRTRSLLVAIYASLALSIGIFLFLFLSCTASSAVLFPSAYAETFVAVKDGAWNSSSTWRGGIAPSDSLGQTDQVYVPYPFQVENLPSHLSNSGRIVVNGTIVLRDLVTNHATGAIKVEEHGTLFFDGFTAILENSGHFYNAGLVDKHFGSIDNFGTLNNTGVVRAGNESFFEIGNHSNGTIVNYGQFSFSNFINYPSGTVINHGNATGVDGIGANIGIFNNTGSFTITNRHFSFENIGIINNLRGGSLKIPGDILNEGIVRNDGIIDVVKLLYNSAANSGLPGEIINSVTGIVNNSGEIDNYYRFDNFGTFTNSGMFSNGGSFVNSGVLLNGAQILTQGSMINSDTGIINNTGILTNLYNVVKNSGIINNSNTIQNAGTIINSGRLINSAYIYKDFLKLHIGNIINNGLGTLVSSGYVL